MAAAECDDYIAKLLAGDQRAWCSNRYWSISAAYAYISPSRGTTVRHELNGEDRAQAQTFYIKLLSDPNYCLIFSARHASRHAWWRAIFFDDPIPSNNIPCTLTAARNVGG